MDFFKELERMVEDRGTCLCVGLDPYFTAEERAALGDSECLSRALEANLRIIAATSPYAACYKPNAAFYEAFGNLGRSLLEKTLEAIPSEIPFIYDAKRGDIESTGKAYAEAIFGGLKADAVTLNPYMGKEAAEPFLAWEGKGLFLLCKTSNPGAGAFQGLSVGSGKLYETVARTCVSWSDRIGLVVAGNDPGALAAVRAAAPEAWFLAPGIGAQGGKAEEAIAAGARKDGRGVLVVAARSVAGAADPAAAAASLRDQMAAIARKIVSGGPRSYAGFSVREAESDKSFDPSLKDRLVRGLLATGCFRLGEFVLKSGKKSPFYIDLRRLISNPTVLADAAEAYAALARSVVSGAALGLAKGNGATAAFDRLAGIPAAGLPLATAAALRMSIPMIWPRMPVKEHGTGNRVEGAFASGEKALLLDDLITTGASKLEAVEILRGEGLVVEDLVVLIERGKQGRRDMEAAGIRLHAFLHVKELFESCERQGLIDAGKRVELERFVDSE
jgi:uridine monophosphate synthetase